jgi:predicted amidohydrolase YtcJ
VEDLQVKGDKIEDLGTAVLTPGFVESHSHPLISSLLTSPPCHYIFPTLTTWDALLTDLKTFHAETPKEKPVIVFGFDKLLLGKAPPDRKEMDEIFGPDRVALVIDNSGHGAYVTTKAMVNAGIDPKSTTIANPPGGSFGRYPDGTCNGQAFEAPGVLAIVGPALAFVMSNPLMSGKRYYQLLSNKGITTASELTYQTQMKKILEALANTPGCPIRLVCYQMSTESDCAAKVTFDAPESMLYKQGIKLWADGSPWIGNIANTFPYIDTEATRLAGIAPDNLHLGSKAMNWTLDELKAILDKNIAGVKETWQFAFHCNGDEAISACLDGTLPFD